MSLVENLEHILFEEDDELKPQSLTGKPKLADLLRSGIPFVVVGARAANAYADEPRTTQDIDVLTEQYKELAEWIHQEYPQLEMKSSELVIRFLIANKPVIDVMIPNDDIFKAALGDTRRFGKFDVASPEAMVALKFSAIFSKHRAMLKKEQDRVDIARMISHTKIKIAKSARYVKDLFPGAAHAFIGFIKKVREDFELD